MCLNRLETTTPRPTQQPVEKLFSLMPKRLQTHVIQHPTIDNS